MFLVSVLISAIRGRYIFPMGNPFSRFVLRLHHVPDVLAQGLVLALLFERHLVKRCLVWICQACVHQTCDSTEHGLVINLCLRVLGLALAVGLGVVEFTCCAMCEADLVALCHFAVDSFHRECIFYVCHSCSAIERRVRNKNCRKFQGICSTKIIENYSILSKIFF